jgi:hypothetical protein
MASVGMPATNHHFLPQCYLKGFVVDPTKPRLFVVDRQERRSFVTNPRNVASKRNFNRVELEGHAPDAIENIMAQLESDVAPALLRVNAAASLANDSDRAAVLSLVSLFACRNPRFRREFANFEERLMKIIAQMMVSSKDRWEAMVEGAQASGHLQDVHGVTYEQIRDFVRGDEYLIGFDNTHHVGVELSAFDKVFEVIAARTWDVLIAPAGSSFITCDHPICLDWLDPVSAHPLYPPALALAGTSVLVPLSSELVLVGIFEARESEIKEMSAFSVARINGRIIAGSDRQVFAQDDRFCYVLGARPKVMKGSALSADLAFLDHHEA